MLGLQDNVRQDIVKLVPSSVLNEICCFVFFDNHPLDTKKLDITVCTTRGEIKEYYQREAVCCFRLDPPSVPREIRILRNSKNEHFYLLSLEGEIVILSRTNTLQVYRSIKNVENYDMDDSALRGQAYLKVICKDDAVPLIFDDNFESLGDAALVLGQLSSCDTLPIMLDLTRKLSEAKYNVKSLKKSYSELTKLRQNLAFTSYKKLQTNLEDSLYDHDGSMEVPLQLKTYKPWVKLCNKKIIICLELLSKSHVPVENVHILLHRTTKSAVVYTTKLFEETPEIPFWKESATKNINSNSATAVVAIIDRKELKYCVSSTVVFSAVICYMINNREYLLPVEDVTISAMETMDENFDALSNQLTDSAGKKYCILTILASSQKIDLCLRHIKNRDEPNLNTKTVFCENLGMDYQLTRLVIHRSSPYHILHGVMVILEEEPGSDVYEVTVYARSQCQVLALIHYIYDAVPHRIVVTTPNQIITAKSDELSICKKEIHKKENRKNTSNPNLVEYGTSILNQSSMVLDYLDKCMIKMNQSKDPHVQLKVGSEIDVFADHVSGFLEFKQKLLQEASKGM